MEMEASEDYSASKFSINCQLTMNATVWKQMQQIKFYDTMHPIAISSPEKKIIIQFNTVSFYNLVGIFTICPKIWCTKKR